MISHGVQIVADSGIFLAAVLQESYSKQADMRRNQGDAQDIQIVGPTLFRCEITAVIRKNVYRGLLTQGAAAKVRANLQPLIVGLTFLVDDALLQRGYELAERFNRPTAYDAQYLAIAERLSCEFWTADERLFNAVQQDL